MEQNNSLEQPVIDGSSGYNAAKTYALYVNPANRHIAGIIGFLGPIDNVTDARNFKSYSITDLTEEEYTEISRSINTNEAMTFLGEDDRTIIVRKLYVEMQENTFFDTKLSMMYGKDNVVKLKIYCVDNTLTAADDITEIEVKNMKKLEVPVSINDKPVENVKMTVGNPSVVSFKLMGEGVHSIRVKAKIPNVDYLWLTAYPQMIKLKDEELAALDQFIANRKTA